ncbi:Ribosomal RNA small subunit methyltransferase A [Alphaproteobacteria bacterium]
MKNSIKLEPLKHLGQNFLMDSEITDRIVYSIGNFKNSIVLEIGPGIGALTKAILKIGKPKHVIVVEKDVRLIPALHKLQAESNGILTVLHDDALLIDESVLINKVRKFGEEIRIVANLPYNIGTELLFKWLNNIELFSSLTIMLQKEVAQRITATPHSSNYGWISIISQLLTEAEVLIDVPPEAFWPQPKVYSSVIHLVPKTAIPVDLNMDKLRCLCKLLFNKRRKMIKKNLEGPYEHIIAQLQNIGINANARAEELSIGQLCKLAALL